VADQQSDETATAQADTATDEAKKPTNTARLVLGAVALQTMTKLLTETIDRMVLGKPASGDDSPAAKPNPVRKFTAGKLAKVATKSKPGAIAVAGGLFAKHLFDRGGKRMKARRAARK